MNTKLVVQSPSLYLDAPVFRHVARGFCIDDDLARKLPANFLDFALRAGFIRQEVEAGEEASAVKN